MTNAWLFNAKALKFTTAGSFAVQPEGATHEPAIN